MSAGDTKECPFCAETIRAAARGCRFCGTVLAPEGATEAGFQALPAVGVPLSPGTIAEAEVADLLAGLVEKSLVLYEEDKLGQGRYRLLETVRQYGRDRLLESQEGEAVRQRHAVVFLAFAEETVLELSRKEPIAWLGRLEREYDNLRAVLDWTLGSDPETALRLAGVLGRFWQVRSHLIEGREWLERALAAGRAAPASLRARALIHLSRLMHWQGDYGRMTEVLEESRALAQQAGDRENLAIALICLALEAHLHGDQVRAGQLMEEASTPLRETGMEEPWKMAGAAVAAAGIAAASASDQPTAELFRQAQAFCRATGDPFVIGGCCRTEALFALRRGDHPRALALSREGLLAAREVGHTVGVHNALEGVAVAWAAQGRAERAARLMGATEAVRETGQWSILPLWAELQAQAETSARAALGEERFDAAWAEGRAMSLPQAIEYALEGAEGDS